MQWIESRNCDVIEDKKEDSSLSLRCMRYPEVKVFVEMFRAKL